MASKLALVTGASSGIGEATVKRYAKSGAKVALLARNAERLDAVAAAIRREGGKAATFVVDLADAAAIAETSARITGDLGTPDIVVNNAGVTKDTLIPRMTDEDWDTVIATNLRSVFLFTRAATLVMMRQRSGRIVNISSVSGIMGNPGQANYSASKAGIIGLTRTVARELAGRKVTVNAICPGFISSEMTDALGPAVLDEVKKRVPAKRLGEADEVADAVLYLASDSASYLTGQVLVLDGGLTA